MAQQGKSTRPAKRTNHTKQANRTGRAKRTMSKRKRAIYRRRRIVVGIAALLALALITFVVYSFGRGIAAIGESIGGERVSLSREATPDPVRSGGVPDCTGGDIRLELSAKTASMPVGGSLEFNAAIVYDGTSASGCLIDASNSSRVLTITSGDQTIWRSDSCPAGVDSVLMAKGDRYVSAVTWPGTRTGDTCVDEADLPRVDRGSYVARLSLKDHPKVQSDPVPILVE